MRVGSCSTPTPISAARSLEPEPQTHVTILLRNVLVVAAAGMLQRVENVILGMTEVVTMRSFLDRDTAK